MSIVSPFVLSYTRLFFLQVQKYIVDLASGAVGNYSHLAQLPYLPRLAAMACSHWDIGPVRYVDAILAAQLPVWQDLVALRHCVVGDHETKTLQQLHAASGLTCLELEGDFWGTDHDRPGGG